MKVVIQQSVLASLMLGSLSCGGKPPEPTVQANEERIDKSSGVSPEISAPNQDASEPPTLDGPTPKMPTPAVKPEQNLINDEAQRLIAEGSEIASEGDISGAEERLKDAINADEKAAEAHYNLGILSEWQGKYDEADKHYKAALDTRVDFAPAVIAVSNLLLRKGNAASALDFAEKQLLKKRKSNELFNAVNRIKLTIGGNLEQIIASTKEVLRKDEKNTEAMINLATAYHKQRKYELAIAVLENAKVLDAENPEILGRQALAHELLGETLKARLKLEEASKLPAGATAEIYNNLGLLYHDAGDFIGAENQFRRALARWPDMLQAQVNLGNALKGQQKYSEADKVFRSALANNKKAPSIYYNLGILYLDGVIPNVEALKRLEEALVFFEKYKKFATSRSADDPVEKYVAEARKRIVVEQKRAEQERQEPKTPTEAVEDDGEEDDEGFE